MPVFRAYFKVMRTAWPVMLINLGVLLGLAMVFSSTAGPVQSRAFSQARTAVAVINRDGESPLVTGLTGYLADTQKLVSYPDDPERLQDALYFRNVEYVLIIPRGFSAAFPTENPVALQKVIVPDSTSSRYVDQGIDNYLKTYRLYQKYGKTVSAAELAKVVRDDLSAEIQVSMPVSAASGPRPFVFFFGYMTYTLLMLVVLGVSTVMLSFNQADVRRRNLCAPLSARRMTMQLAAGHALVALGWWAALVVFGLTLYGRNLLASGLLGLFCLNSLAYTAVCVSIALLVGTFIRNRSAQSAAVNVIGLGMSFLSGAFVPQSLLSPVVLSFSRFLPAYWYVKANDAIGALTRPSQDSVSPIYGNVLILIGFAAAIFSVTLLLTKERAKSAN